MRLSEKLQRDHECGDFGKALAGYSEEAKRLEDAIAEFAKHDSWRCAYYSECHCGLDDETDRLQIPRIPYPKQ